MVLVALIPTLSLTAGAAAWWPAGAEISEAGGTSHVVRPGETLYSIARTHGRDVATLVALNGLKDPSRIQAGQVLVLVAPETAPDPAPDAAATATAEPAASEARQYTVVAGDTMYGVARRFGVAVQALLAANSLTNPNLIQIGQVLTVPGPLAIPNGTERPSIGVEIVPRPTPYPPLVTPPTPPAAPTTATAPTTAALAAAPLAAAPAAQVRLGALTNATSIRPRQLRTRVEAVSFARAPALIAFGYPHHPQQGRLRLNNSR